MVQRAKKKEEGKGKKEQELPSVPKGYEEVGDYWDKMFAFEKKGDFISGIYKGSVANIGENESTVHIFEVDGERIGVWGSVILDKRMDSVKMNAETMIVMEGMEVSEKSGRLYKDFKVYQKKGTGTARQHRQEDIPF